MTKQIYYYGRRKPRHYWEVDFFSDCCDAFEKRWTSLS
ncbi:Uncharacterised protein [Dermacoccus nishinomiyaensis]|nr:hypothetical protein HMPREF0321_1952 [Dermacoccus sp. Ellin185]STD71427.1 Uncharacterised protein [Dermacoccus nishinomiyaensis]